MRVGIGVGDPSMASSWTPVSDEELQKAKDDLEELIAKEPIPDEFKWPPVEVKENMKEEQKDPKEKKKKLYMLPPEEMQIILNYKCDEPQESEAISKLAEEDYEQYGDLKRSVSITQVFTRHCWDKIRATQENMRHQLQTKGYVTYVATDDETEDEEAAAPSRSSRGRRRHRPGVTNLPEGSRS